MENKYAMCLVGNYIGYFSQKKEMPFTKQKSFVTIS